MTDHHHDNSLPGDGPIPVAGDRIPRPAQREAANAALAADGIETGWWNPDGRPAPWPDDIEQWTPERGEPSTPETGYPPF